MIREIKAEDKEQVLRLIKMFYEERLERSGAHYSIMHAGIHFDQVLSMPGVLALCAEENGKIVGIIAGISSSILFAKELALQELVWYVEPDARNQGLKLLRAFELRAKETGVGQIMMVAMEGDHVNSLYPRLGYTRTQSTYVKFLE